MPRVAQHPRTSGREVSAGTLYRESPMKIPLNDDRQEKAVRLQSRQALHEMQMNQIKAAVTPLRARKSLGGNQNQSPGILIDLGKENGGGLAVVDASGVTPMKRVPILANFEEWMKMATDNKINAANSWNFALIDYFHDMSLLKEGNTVNFQKASCTLDGCVKIYTSRVDSVATETGKLLSGLADGGSKKRSSDDDQNAEGQDLENESGDDGTRKKVKKRAQRSSEATLVDSFEKLQLKKMELEFSVDPLFKKASADFDEGGARGLLLNHLTIDGQGRIVFDSSDDIHDASAPEDSRDEADAEEVPGNDDTQTARDRDAITKQEELETNIAGLGMRFFPNLALLESQDICPSLKSFDLGDPSGALELPFLKPSEDCQRDRCSENTLPNVDRAAVGLDEVNLAVGFDEDDAEGFDAGFDLPPDTGFGEGGEAWAREAALEPQFRVNHAGPLNSDSEGDGDAALHTGANNATQYGVTLNQSQQPQRDSQHDNILAYFDTALSTNWAGPEHWRIRRIKSLAALKGPSAVTSTAKRKEKAPFEINFAARMTQQLADQIYTKSGSASSIYLPKKEWKSKNRNLLPDDKHFNSSILLRLFLKPKARIGIIRGTGMSAVVEEGRQDAGLEPGAEMDEEFWARRDAEEVKLNQQDAGADDVVHAAQYDANFFQDDGLAGGGGMDDDPDDDFADAREQLSPDTDGIERADGGLQCIDQALHIPSSQSTEGGFGAQLVAQSRRIRPEYVQYARVAKKVDVRRLKEEMWKGMEFGEDPCSQPPEGHESKPEPEIGGKVEVDKIPLKFTQVMNGLKSAYNPAAMADISISYCFICLLHLANEKGLMLSNEDGFQDLGIRKDYTAEIMVHGD